MKYIIGQPVRIKKTRKVGVIISDAIKVHGVNTVTTEYIIRFDKAQYTSKIAYIGNNMYLTTHDVSFEESWFEPLPVTDIKPGEVYMNYETGTQVKLVRTFDERYMLGGIDKNFDVLYADAPCTKKRMIERLNITFPIKVS